MTFEHKNWMLQPVEWEWQYNGTSNLSVTYIPEVGAKFYVSRTTLLSDTHFHLREKK